MTMSFLKTGNAAKTAMQQNDAAVELRRANKETPLRFWMEQNKEKRVTFLDGALDDSGMLLAVMYQEHNLKLNGKFGNTFVCVQETEVCPICASGDYPSLVAAFTVIDHSEYKNDEGKIYKNTRKLFVCKSNAYKLLQHKATKQGGLVGVTFDVTRIGEKSERVGSDFEFVTKRSRGEIAQAYGLKDDDVQPFDYANGKTIVYRSAEEIAKLGIGSHSKPLGAGDSPFKANNQAETPDYTKNL